MAVLFSAVTLSANNQEVEFFVGGIPRELDDLEGWTAFDNFMEDIDEETEVSVHAEAYDISLSQPIWLLAGGLVRSLFEPPSGRATWPAALAVVGFCRTALFSLIE